MKPIRKELNMKNENELRVECPNVINEAYYEAFFTAFHFDIFFIIMAKLKGKHEAVITFDEIKSLYERRPWRTNELFEKKIIDICSDILRAGVIPVQWEDGDQGAICLYTECKVNTKTKTIKVIVNAKYTMYFENNLYKLGIWFTPYSVNIFVNLRSLYSKTLYRRLMQYRTHDDGYFLKDAEFRKVFRVPTGYDYHNIKQKILDPAIKEITASDPKISKLTCNVRRQGGAHGKIIGYEFEFDWLGKNKNIRTYRRSLNKLLAKYDKTPLIRSEYAAYSHLVLDTLEYWEGQRSIKDNLREENFFVTIKREHQSFFRQHSDLNESTLFKIEEIAIESASFIEKEKDD